MEKSKIKVEITGKLFDKSILDPEKGFGDIIFFDQKNDIPDETIKVLIKNNCQQNIAFAIFSSPLNPGHVHRGIKNVELIKKQITKELANHIVDHIDEGDIDGLSYAIWPFYQPLSNSRLPWFVQRKALSGSISDWLLSIAQKTSVIATSEKIETKFIDPLHFLSKLFSNNQFLQKKVHESLKCFDDKSWRPVNIVAHNDIWKGNILLNKYISYLPFVSHPEGAKWVVIDWSGSQIHGYPIYDLVRFAQSFKLSTGQLRQQLARHCDILHCDFNHARCYLVCSLAHLAMNLEYFPVHRFIELAGSCLALVDNACE